MEIEIVCGRCGQSGSLHEYGEIDIGCIDAWRETEMLTWDTATNALVVKVRSFVEHDASFYDIEDEYQACGWACSHCGATAKKLDDLAEPKYGVDRWGRVLDSDGQPHGPMLLHPHQQRMEL